MTPLVSVVITNYNYGRFLRSSIDSVLAQTYPHVEVIVVDDGSTDDSPEVIASYGTRVRSIVQANGGQAAALAAGAAAATGEILCLLDADDVWSPTKVQRIVDTFNAHPRVNWIRHKLAFIDESGRALGGAVPGIRGSGPIPPDPLLFIERIVVAPTSAIAVRSAVAQRVFPLPAAASFRLDADAILLARMFQLRLEGWSLDEQLGGYRRHAYQTYVGRRDLARLLNRQIEVDTAIATILGTRHVSTSSYKHRAILAALAGQPPLQSERAGAFLAGVRASFALLHRPAMFARQLLGLVLAYGAPALWIRRLERSMQFGPVD